MSDPQNPQGELTAAEIVDRALGHKPATQTTATGDDLTAADIIDRATGH